MHATTREPHLPHSDHFHLHRLAEGVYAAIAEQQGKAGSNAGIIDLGGRTLVFDTTLTPEAARDLLRVCRELTGRAPLYVVNSHWHNDHVQGNEVFARARDDTTIVATAMTRELIATRGEENLREIRAEDPGLAADPMLNRLRLPQQTFDQRLVFHGERRTVELLSWGGGHTSSDAFLILGDERIAFLGDLLVVRQHPWMGDGDPRQLARILARIEELPLDTVIPGHGPQGTLDDCAQLRAYIAAVDELARDAVRQGRRLTDLQPDALPEPFASWGGAAAFDWNIETLYSAANSRASQADTQE